MMDMTVGMAGDAPVEPLRPTGVDFSSETQATSFLAAILDDDQLKLVGEAYAYRFWYGIVVVVGVAAIVNAINRIISYTRSVNTTLSSEKAIHADRLTN